MGIKNNNDTIQDMDNYIYTEGVMGDKLKEAKYHTVEGWAWECPECGYYNETNDDPGYYPSVICEQCNGKFEPVEV